MDNLNSNFIHKEPVKDMRLPTIRMIQNSVYCIVYLKDVIENDMYRMTNINSASNVDLKAVKVRLIIRHRSY